MTSVERHHSSVGEPLPRVFDIALAAFGLIFLAPLILLVLVAILMETGRPVLFAQERLGKNGHRFWMYKFRKFGPSASTHGCPVTLRADTRMTQVGRILAVTKLDEVPQLLNILRGDMALVGPRPESVAFEDCFNGPFRAVLEFRPGILGPTQVAFRNESDLYPENLDPTDFYRRVLFPAKARLDLDYYPQRTILSDVGWILRGVLAVIGVTPKFLTPFWPSRVLSTEPAAAGPLANRSADHCQLRGITTSTSINAKKVNGE